MGLASQLKNHLIRRYSDSIVFIDHPIKVEKGQSKPYSIELNGEVVYSILSPVNGETKPILFDTHKYFGEPEPDVLSNLEKRIDEIINSGNVVSS